MLRNNFKQVQIHSNVTIMTKIGKVLQWFCKKNYSNFTQTLHILIGFENKSIKKHFGCIKEYSQSAEIIRFANDSVQYDSKLNDV